MIQASLLACIFHSIPSKTPWPVWEKKLPNILVRRDGGGGVIDWEDFKQLRERESAKNTITREGKRERGDPANPGTKEKSLLRVFYQCRCEWWTNNPWAQQENLNYFYPGLACSWKAKACHLPGIFICICLSSSQITSFFSPCFCWLTFGWALTRNSRRGGCPGRISWREGLETRQGRRMYCCQGGPGEFADSRGRSYLQRRGIKWA